MTVCALSLSTIDLSTCLLYTSLAKEFDVQTLQGSISHPGIMEKMGAKGADILIAVTDNDEVNLVACQVAHTLFQIPKKIARVDSEYFLNPLWNTLYSDKNLPVDLVISPDVEIAKAILNLIEIPGTTAVFPLVDEKLYLLDVYKRQTKYISPT